MLAAGILWGFAFPVVKDIWSSSFVLVTSGITTLSLAVLAVIYRPLVLECVDPGFLRSVSRAGGPASRGGRSFSISMGLSSRLPSAPMSPCDFSSATKA